MSYTYEDFGITKSQATLENGIRFVLFRKKNAPLDWQAEFFAGSSYDHPEKPGMAHLSEHLFAGATERFSTKESLARHFETLGGGRNAYTNRMTMAFEASTGNPASREEFLNGIEEIMCRPLLKESDFADEQRVVLQEYRQSFSDQNYLAWEDYRRSMLSGTPYEHRVLGTEEGIQQTTIEDARAFRGSHIHADNGVFIFTGDIDHDWLADRLSRFPIARGKSHRTTEPLSFAGPSVQTIHVPDQKDIKIRIGFRTPQYSDPVLDYALGLGAAMLASSYTSYLYKKLRIENQYVYGVWAGSSSSERYGTFSISTALHRDHVNHALEIIKEGIGWLTKGEFTDNDVSHEKAYLVASLPRSFEQASSMIGHHSFMTLTRFDEPHDPFEEINQKLAITKEDVVRAAREHFTPDNMVAVFRGDTPEQVDFSL